MAEMMRIPGVWFVQQRGGPSTATVIYSQQETRLTCWGGNGEGHRLVYSTSSHQELFDYAIKAFNQAWRYRFPTFVLGDGYQAKMREAVTLYDPAERDIALVPTEPMLGKKAEDKGERSAAHYRNTYNVEEELYEKLSQHTADWDAMAAQVVEWQATAEKNVDLLLIAHGVVSRAAAAAYRQLRDEGYQVAFFRPITLRPFPHAALATMAEGARQALVAESAYGQLLAMVRDSLYGKTTLPIYGLLQPGVGITAEQIVGKARQVLQEKGVTPDGDC